MIQRRFSTNILGYKVVGGGITRSSTIQVHTQTSNTLLSNENQRVMQRIRSFRKREPLTSYQINSDLHLEVGQQYSSILIPASTPYLVLAGDIGRLADYLTQIEQFELVFLVLGNHEKAWMFSHTHYMTKGGVKVVSNQRGYVLPEAVTGHELQKKENRTGFDIREVI